jgi:hypothetical protein
MAGVAIAGFVLAVICAVLLARFGQTEHQAKNGRAGLAAESSGSDPHPATRC